MEEEWLDISVHRDKDKESGRERILPIESHRMRKKEQGSRGLGLGLHFILDGMG
jgi:hypothetical protein